MLNPVDYSQYKSPYPTTFIPAGGEPFVAIDRASGKDEACEVKGFFEPDGTFHIQEINFL